MIGRRVLFAAFLFCMISGNAIDELHAQLHSKNPLYRLCNREPLVTPNETKNVYFRAFPFARANSIAVNERQISLLELFAQNDTLSFATQKRLNLAAKQDDAPLPFEDSKLPFFVGAHQGTDESGILHLRGNVLTFFPRVLLANPQISNAVLQPDDLIVTLELNTDSFQKRQDQSIDEEVQSKNAADPVHDWFYERIANKKEQGIINIKLAGPKMPKSLRGDRKFGVKFFSFPLTPLSMIPAEKAVTSLANLLDERIVSENDLNLGSYFSAGGLKNQLLLIVVKRRVGPYSFRYIVPFKFAGSFALNGRDYQRVFGINDAEDNNSAEPQQEWKLESYIQFPLMDGDIVELTTPFSITLFRQQFK